MAHSANAVFDNRDFCVARIEVQDRPRTLTRDDGGQETVSYTETAIVIPAFRVKAPAETTDPAVAYQAALDLLAAQGKLTRGMARAAIVFDCDLRSKRTIGPIKLNPTTVRNLFLVIEYDADDRVSTFYFQRLANSVVARLLQLAADLEIYLPMMLAGRPLDDFERGLVRELLPGITEAWAKLGSVIDPPEIETMPSKATPQQKPKICVCCQTVTVDYQTITLGTMNHIILCLTCAAREVPFRQKILSWYQTSAPGLCYLPLPYEARVILSPELMTPTALHYGLVYPDGHAESFVQFAPELLVVITDRTRIGITLETRPERVFQSFGVDRLTTVDQLDLAREVVDIDHRLGTAIGIALEFEQYPALAAALQKAVPGLVFPDHWRITALGRALGFRGVLRCTPMVVCELTPSVFDQLTFAKVITIDQTIQPFRYHDFTDQEVAWLMLFFFRWLFS